MRGGFFGSVLFHVAVVAIAYFGLPYVSPEPAIVDAPIYVDVINVADEVNPPPPEPEPEPDPAPPAPPPPPPPRAARSPRRRRVPAAPR
ncbi:MAG: hypothetical protein OXR84_07955, partial [Magnetovibrio sp.]|nr:hypothetical protein [Magnetovibrio sp.]